MQARNQKDVGTKTKIHQKILKFSWVLAEKNQKNTVLYFFIQKIKEFSDDTQKALLSYKK